MENLEYIQQQILNAKEKRWLKQQAIIQENKKTLIIFKFNIPSWPKNSLAISNAFEKALADFIKHLTIKKITYKLLSVENTALGPEVFILSEKKASLLKKHSMEFEENHQIGRLLDIDILDNKGEIYERRKKRQCFLCNENALLCMRKNKHSSEDLRSFFNNMISTFLNEQQLLPQKEKAQ